MFLVGAAAVHGVCYILENIHIEIDKQHIETMNIDQEQKEKLSQKHTNVGNVATPISKIMRKALFTLLSAANGT